MRSVVEEAIYFTLSVFTFTIALAYSVDSIIKVGKEFDQAAGTEGSVYIMETEIPEQITVTGAEVIGSLYKLNFSEQHIEVNGVEITTNRDLEKKQHLIPTSSKYIQEIEYDDEGQIEKITYTTY